MGKFDYHGERHQLHCNEKALGNALHGFIYNQKFEVVDAKSTPDEVILLLRYDYQGEAAGYPYPFRTELLYRLDKNGKLTCTCAIENTGKKGAAARAWVAPLFYLAPKGR
jgi:aldose 1-epimerase